MKKVRTMKLALLALLACVMLASGSITCDRVTEVDQGQTSTAGIGIGAPFRGATSLEERISNHPTIVKATLTSVSADVVAGAERLQGSFYVVLKFNLSVSEYLKGSGGNSIAAMRVVSEDYSSRKEAEDAIPGIHDRRDTQWDDRDAIFFLKDVREDIFPSLRGQNRYFLGHPNRSDNYSIASRLEKAWLPAVAPNSSATTGDSQEFLLDVPSPSGSTTPTITLGNLKKRVAEIAAELNGGDGSEAYRECVKYKYKVERLDRHRESTGQPGRNFRVSTSYEFGSGQSADTVLYEDELGGAYSAEEKAELQIDGRDSGLFSVLLGDLVPFKDPDGAELTEVLFVFDQIIVASRPLPAGEYRFNRHFIPLPFLACNHTLTDELTVTVSAPAGTLHEAFFDPVTVGSAVTADATNGVLKPVAFTDANGASATIESISYESGTVRVKVVPWSELSGQILDFIELDGRVSLSLSVTNSTVHTADDVFAWSVGSQPWEDGDKLMVRIRPGIATFASPPARVTAAASGDDSVNLSWDAGRGAAGYQVQRRESGEETWEMEDDSVTERSYVVSGLSCETSYDFRVGAYGDGRRYEAEVRSWSAPVSETTGACTQPPVFDAASYSFEVSEDAVAGTQVGTVSATDPDAGDTLTYSVVSGNEAEKFAIDASAGVITVAGTLDYETASSYTLTVEASDGKGGTARATVTIGVVEVADTGAPVFGASAYAFSVIEGASVGSTVGAVSATDPNEGDTVAYSISAGNDAGKFAIDGSTGRITLAGTLDYQTASSYTLTVTASDRKGGKGRAVVTVSVEQASCSNGTAVASPSDNAGLVADCLTLLALRDSLEGTVVLNWSSDVAIGKWKGVGVAGTPGRVQSLSLSGLELDGTVPSALAKLSGLELLELSENNLTGAIPTELGGLTRLGRLSLGQNRLTGSIPPSLGRLSNLYSLAVADNDLSGSIPSTLGSLSRLLYLSLGGNDLSGTVPSELGSLASLQYLYLDTNDLTGGIPTQLGSLAKLEILSLYGNKLTGGIPSELGNLSKLEELMLSRNGLTGSIPSSLERLSKLVYLRLSGNRLTGCIPAGLRNVADHDLGSLGLAYCASEA